MKQELIQLAACIGAVLSLGFSLVLVLVTKKDAEDILMEIIFGTTLGGLFLGIVIGMAVSRISGLI